MEKETYRILCDFEIHTDHLISARRPDLATPHQKTKKQNKQTKNSLGR